MLLLAPLLLGGLCEGEGSKRPGRITQAPSDVRCWPINGPYPSGFDLLPQASPRDPARGLVMQFSPAGLLSFDLESSPPRPLGNAVVSSLPGDGDSDGDGWDDAERFRSLGLCPAFNPGCVTYPRVGAVHAAFDDLVFVSASGYEEVLFYDPAGGELTELIVESPASSPTYRAEDHPFLPPEGESALRTALATKVCVYPPEPIDSLGEAIPADALCDPERTGYLTKFTAATAHAAGRLFVATSNLKSPARARFYPGSVLVFELDTPADPPRLRPDVLQSVVYTSAFNPTGLTPHRTAGGHELVLVTLTGGIDQSGTLLSDGAVDVIDAEQQRLIATIPLGRAGPSFGPVAVDPTGRLALIGAESQRNLYAIDLAVLEDPTLYEPGRPPAVLDGSDPGFADARIYWAESPFVLPSRAGGPPLSRCPPRTNVAINDAGTRAFATDWCDGTLSVVELELAGAGPPPLAPGRIRTMRSVDLLAPKLPELWGSLSAPSMVRVRDGRPGVDFDGPDVFFIANEPEGQVCALRGEY